MLDGDLVVPCWEWTVLERAQAVDDDGEERFLGDAVDAVLVDGTILETNPAQFKVVGSQAIGMRLLQRLNGVVVVGAASAWFVEDLNGQLGSGVPPRCPPQECDR